VEFSFQAALLAVAAGFVVAFFVMPAVVKLALRVGAVDRPEARKVHQKPMPRLGGLGIVSAFLGALLVLYLSGYREAASLPMLGIVLGALMVFVLGMCDDIVGLSPWTKLAVQLGAALVAVYFGVKVHVMTNPFDGVIQLGKMSLPLTHLWIIGVTNAVNLIDGLDGLAAGVSAIAALTIGVVALRMGQGPVAIMALALIGAVAGFLPYNFHPAKTFMGDSGSLFLGFVLSCLSVTGLAKGAAVISLFLPIVILGIPVFDTLFAIVRRVNNGSPILYPDRSHLHHRLMAMGLSHRQSVVVIYLISLVLGGVAVLLTYVTTPQAVFILVLVSLFILVGAGKIGIMGGKDHAAESREVSNQDGGVAKGM